MQIDIKARFTNPATCTALVAVILATVYQILAILGITPAITQDAAQQIAALVITLLTGLGVLVDPTTKGISDASTQEVKSIQVDKSDPDVTTTTTTVQTVKVEGANDISQDALGVTVTKVGGTD